MLGLRNGFGGVCSVRTIVEVSLGCSSVLCCCGFGPVGPRPHASNPRLQRFVVFFCVLWLCMVIYILDVLMMTVLAVYDGSPPVNETGSLR